eukprot:4660830-Amphidinium_carterae.1
MSVVPWVRGTWVAQRSSITYCFFFVDNGRWRWPSTPANKKDLRHGKGLLSNTNHSKGPGS